MWRDHVSAGFMLIALLGIWSVLAFVALIRDMMMPGPWITAGLCAIAVYFLGAGALRGRKPE